MFKCENCESGYPARIASSWDFCPRCLERSKTVVPLTFELGWSAQSDRSAVGSGPAPVLTGSAESMTSTALD